MVIEPARDDDLQSVRDLLRRQRLPLDDVDAHVPNMVVARDDGRVVGAAALEVYPEGALLRSVVVDPAKQGQGLGHQLTEAALRLARGHGVPAVFLLTTTAEGFFPRFGFARITREQVPVSVQTSVEFRTACPASATVLRKTLDAACVLFACVHNAGRSQIAAAFFNALADPARAHARSAGTEPGERIHPEVVRTMREEGLDLAGLTPQKLTPELARDADLLITMGCGEACPFVPGLLRADWPLDDPKGQPDERVRAIRDEIRTRVSALIHARGWARRG